MVTEYPWVSVSGFGAHIKSTPRTLIVQKKNTIEEYPITDVKNLLIVGGHTLHSSAVLNLIRHGAIISFFEADGTPAGTVRPPNDRSLSEQYELQKTIPRQRFATALAQTSVQARLFFMEREEELKNIRLFYEGELELLHKSREELAFLIKLDEIRRMHQMMTDMYYEIMSRNLPPELGFRRRSRRPHTDPVNAMLSFGYALLFGNCTVAALGARLDPDSGFLHDGKDSLIYDLIDPLKPAMVDSVVFQIARESLREEDYELTPDRCMLADDLIREITGRLHASINTEIINRQVANLADSIRTGSGFKVLY
ncbi:MAG TPA: CRISPR-associated endonuclease Cas1 [Methanoregula sp.]|nr:CRISPR-associated endonuclease Cas1 [Methanoregula sp.]